MNRTTRVLRAFSDGARLRCPACREGRMYRTHYRMHDTCPRCGVAFEAGRGEFTGAIMFGMGFLGVLALMGFFVLRFFTPAPEWLQLAWAAWWGGVFPFFFYRNMKGVWIGAIHGFDKLEPPRRDA